ncbi:MAG: DUF1729 domain-containing protein [Candidatus Ancillula trichonymphae]|jgi:fatty acid synthase|nr:DUF1729 domain-containing protein [Candidatus Ancillula trichonymphae]
MNHSYESRYENFADELVNEKYALVFGGQGVTWRNVLGELAVSKIGEDSRAVVDKMRSICEPVHDDLIVAMPDEVDYFAASPNKRHKDSSAYISLPGILLTQYALLRTLTSSFDFQKYPATVSIGHSQGVLGVEVARIIQELGDDHLDEVASVFAIAQLIGAAATLQSAYIGIYSTDSATAMLSVKGVPKSLIQKAIDKTVAIGSIQDSAQVAVKNSEEHSVISGVPKDLQILQSVLEKIAHKSQEHYKAKLSGGAPLKVQAEFLDVSAPFHSPLLAEKLEFIETAAKKCGIDVELASKLATDVLVDPVDWVTTVHATLETGVKYFIDLGPGIVMTKITKGLIQGSNTGIVSAGSASLIQKMLASGYTAQLDKSWEKYNPEVLTLPNGKLVVDTAFSRLTGRSPIMLAGMTPTTVDPGIVAAAANAGYWAELAGGGQVTADVFNTNITKLQGLLEKGRAVQFNSMFLDRYLWNLQFGVSKVVSKVRASGAPIDGVVITAGIPEFDEAVQLVKTLTDEGFPYIAFKPGTTDQIQQVLRIAEAVPEYDIIMQVEDGHAGGHHSWENLDDLLLATYADIRRMENVVLCVGGGIGIPDRAADYISGDWALKYHLIKMPVDGVLVGTAAMTTKEAQTTPEVKELLLKTEGISIDDNNGWIGENKSKGGMMSSLSHLRADIYEINNDSAACARLILEVTDNPELLVTKREEIIEALNKTAKKYFGDIDKMTYYEFVKRFADLCFLPNQNAPEKSWVDRFYDLLQRVEARIIYKDSGDFISLFASQDDLFSAVEGKGSVLDYEDAILRLKNNYPAIETTFVTTIDEMWFIELCRKHPKPVPFTPRLDNELFKWWGSDSLWQSHDSRYKASECRIIPGPVSVAGIDRINEPVADLLERFENAVVERLSATNAGSPAVFSRLQRVQNPIDFIKRSKHISWTDHLIPNPAYILRSSEYEIKRVPNKLMDIFDLVVKIDTYWDEDADPYKFHAVRELVIPIVVPFSSCDGACPIVDGDRLPQKMQALLAATAGVGSRMTSGDFVDKLPEMEPVKQNIIGGVQFDKPTFNRARFDFTATLDLGVRHGLVTGEALTNELQRGEADAYERTAMVPDALLSSCWPPIYAALGSALKDNYPVIEGLLKAVHLDHTVNMVIPLEKLVGKRLRAHAWAQGLKESASGRIVDVRVAVVVKDSEGSAEDEELAITFRERFAIQGRVSGTDIPSQPDEAGGKFANDQIVPTTRRLLRQVMVKAPANMTPFARVSGDYNPIHTSVNIANIAEFSGPIVHGMWLSAVAQHLISANYKNNTGLKISGWTAQWYSPTNLEDEIQLSAYRTSAIIGGGLIVEVIAKIGDTLAARFTASVEPARTAYCYPGQGVQQKGMGLDEITASKASKEIWERADKHTREVLGFSVLAIVRDNPTEIVINGVKYFHPDGLINLTQFTQVALTILGFAQTARMREAGIAVENSYFAGHSLGEYIALSSYANAIPLESVIELVFARGCTMHNLVPRDADGRSNYKMGVLRPNQFGITDKNVKEYVASIAQKSGEFLEIVNYNLAGAQYAVTGTIAGLEALKKDTSERVKAYGGRGAYMDIPGIDVPFHSSVLQNGVPDFRKKLQKLLPKEIDFDTLAGSYIPNLVARPFELTYDFAKSILDVVPSESVREIIATSGAWASAVQDKKALGRLLLIELLCWQFASPVRWIETQKIMFTPVEQGGLGIEQFVEVGLKNQPTLTGLATKTLQLPEFSGQNTIVYNVQRDFVRIYLTDDDPIPTFEFQDTDKATTPAPVESSAAPATPAQTESASAQSDATAVQNATPAVNPTPAGASVDTSDENFKASDAIKVLFAYSNKINPEQIGPNDTAETLTNGVSSRRNQLLMDMSAELGLATIDSAAEAPVSTLYNTVDKLAHNYKAFGPILGEIFRTNIRKLFGAAGVKQSRIANRVQENWHLGENWADFVTAEIVLGTREGTSMRQGDLTTLAPLAPSSASDVDALIDSAIMQIAARRGVQVFINSSAGGSAGGSVVDSAALNELAESITGDSGILANVARDVLDQLGLASVAQTGDDPDAENQAVVEAVAAELGQDWFKRVSPKFNAKQVVLFDDRWASAKEDLARIYTYGPDSEEVGELNLKKAFIGLGKDINTIASWYASKAAAAADGNNSLADVFEKIAADALKTKPDEVNDLEMQEKVVVITGAAPNSIAGAIAGKLLEKSGAFVVITASNIDAKRLAYAKKLYRTHANMNAKLWLVPVNLSSYRDVDEFISWIGQEQKESVGTTTKLIKPALVPDLFFPFAAPRVVGTLADAGPEAEMETRLLLWSVERMIAGLSRIGIETDIAHKLHVVLPGSPNRGIFGGDGAYGEVKSAFDAIVKKWNVEKRWAKHVTLAHPKIGWVRGTSLMGGNDPLVAAVEKAGVRTYSTIEIADELLSLCTPSSRTLAKSAPLDADFTGGLGGREFDLAALKREAYAGTLEGASAASEDAKSKGKGKKVHALPTPKSHKLPKVDLANWDNLTASLEDLRVIIGIGEVGPWGSGRTRFEAEHGIQNDGTFELTTSGVLELAWMMNLIHWSDTPTAGWYDENNNFVPEGEIRERFIDEVVARCGIREYVDDELAWINDLSTQNDVSVFLDRDITFTVPTKELAESYAAMDPKKTRISALGDEWEVKKLAGTKTRVPRKVAMTRRVGGQLPTSFNPAKWGIPTSMLESVDRLAIWNLVATVDAFLSSGFSPAELLQAVHPSDVGSTQGTGIGGTDSMRKLFVDSFLGEERPSDILQEALPNVIAAHVMQSYIGGYGVMVHPVGACATAAVSIEDAVDKIDCGKADFVVAGAIDDISVESISGFGDMNATAKTQDLLDKGIDKRFVSRANDRRRAGFVESEGGGAVLITRGDIALKLGLPVFGIIGYARSFADGAHTSIPAPGLGALGAARGGVNSKLVQNLARLGVAPDDVNVISKHDTSTNANDPNESELYTRLSTAIGRTPGNPLFVVSQKTVTGHAKGGAAVFQINGLCQIFKSGKLPANRALDCVGEEFKEHSPVVWLREPLELMRTQTIKAGLITSLGFGHVAGLIALVNPVAFEAVVVRELGAEAASEWRRSANERLHLGQKSLELAQVDRKKLFEPIDHRRFDEKSRGYDPHEVEAGLLLSPDSHLAPSGKYELF